MRIIFDQGTPAPLRRSLREHTVETAYELGWSDLKNGELLAEAETAGFDLLITTDQNLRYQQNLTKRKIAIVVLLSASWPKIQNNIESILDAVESASIGTFEEVSIV